MKRHISQMRIQSKSKLKNNTTLQPKWTKKKLKWGSPSIGTKGLLRIFVYMGGLFWPKTLFTASSSFTPTNVRYPPCVLHNAPSKKGRSSILLIIIYKNTIATWWYNPLANNDHSANHKTKYKRLLTLVMQT